jgi:hypothetical protein
MGGGGKIMIDKRALHDELTEMFIVYQHRLDQPFPSDTESPEAIRLKYMNDPIFHSKVASLVSGVMHIVDKYIDSTEPV